MSEWFHAEASQQVGPLSVEEMAARFRAGRITLETLVWRDGLPAWQPLRTVVDELGLLQATAAPPLPPSPPAPPLPPQLPGHAGVAGRAAPAAQPLPTLPAAPRRGLSGGVIAALVIGGGIVVLVPVLAILAAIALPAYQQYTARAKVVQAVAALQPLKTQVLEFAEANGRCPTNDDAGFPATDAFVQQGISQLQVGRFNSSQCGIEATLAVGNSTLDGHLLWLEYAEAEQAWVCSGESPDSYLPAECRG